MAGAYAALQTTLLSIMKSLNETDFFVRLTVISFQGSFMNIVKQFSCLCLCVL